LFSLYLCFFPETHQTFELDNSLFKDYIYALWLIYIRKGILSLSLYDEDTKKWGPCKNLPAWVFINFLLENQLENQEILIIHYEEEKKELKINLNKYICFNLRDMLMCYGLDIVTKMLRPLHIWKCLGNATEAKHFWDTYTAVNEKFIKIRKIVKENDIPRRLELYYNLELDQEGNVNIIEYPETMEGVIKSFVDRYEYY
jgi:dipeptidyl-peptidase-3